MQSLAADVRYALRALRRSPAYAAIAVLCLALGIGTNTTIFSAINGMLLRPLGYHEPDRLLRVWATAPKFGDDEMELSLGDFQDFRARMTTVQGLAAYDDETFAIGGVGDRDAARVEGARVSWNMFRILGLQPVVGRDFLKEEGVAGAPRVVLLGHSLWQRQFGGDQQVVGKTVMLDGRPHTIVGVMAPRMRFPNTRDLWVPFAEVAQGDRGYHGYDVLGRLAPGATHAQADEEVRRIAADLGKAFPQSNAGFGARVVEFHRSLVDEYRSVLWTMLGAVSFVLLIACGNVANLLLARATARQREIALRVALGASRARIVRQLLVESAIVSIAAGALATLIAIWGIELVNAAIPYELPFWMDFGVDRRVLVYTLGISALTAALFSLVPAIQSTKPDLTIALKDGGRGASAGGSRHRLRSALMVGEVALCVVLLVSATLMMRSFVNLRTTDPGFRTERVMTAQVLLAGERYDSDAARARFFGDVVTRLTATPGVEHAAAISSAPLSDANSSSRFDVDGQPFAPDDRPSAQSRGVAGSYFAALDIPLVAGRTFTEQEQLDTLAASGVAIVNETFAARYWPGQSALGKRIRWGAGAPWMNVVGVVRTVKQKSLDERPANQLYVPYPTFAFRSMSLIVRTSGDPASITAAIRRVIRDVDPLVPLYGEMTLQAMRTRSTWDSRLFSSMFLVFGIVALVLSSVGLYGVIAYTVTQRTHEIGVRMALGARPRDVFALVVGQGARLTGVGVAVGLVLALGVTRALRSQLVGVSPTDPLSFGGISLLLAVIALAACYLPARRAVRVDPARSLTSA